VPRIPYLTDETVSPEGKAEWERMRQARGSGPGHLYELLAHSPKLMSRWAAFAETLRNIDRDGSVTLDDRSRELAIIQVARLTGADYEWSAHAPIAQRLGVSDEQIAALLRDDPAPFSPADRALLAYAAESTSNVDVRDATAAELKRHFDDRQVLELTMTIAFYNCVARVLQGLAIDLEEGRTGIPRGQRA
jgi:AhpD family alkylhydroperoxidase